MTTTMTRTITVLVLASAMFATGCATAYRSIDDNFTGGGYNEIRLAPDKWRVVFSGNGFPSRSEAEAFLMRRAAELSLEQGKRYFMLRGHEQWMKRRITDEGNVVISPVNEAVVIALAEQDEDAFDAVKIIAETDEAAEGRLSQAAKKTLASL